MKFSLIFLLVSLVVISQQQRSRAMLWYPPYFLPQPANNYNNIQEDVPYFRYFNPTAPIINLHQNIELSPAISNIPDYVSDDAGLEEIQSRTEGLNRYSTNKNQQQQGRFFFLLNSGTTGGLNNLFYKTATFTLTSTLTLATVQSCIPLDEFVVGSQGVTCRRKRREISSHHDDSDDQFSIKPSQTLPVTPTVTGSSLINWENDREKLLDNRIVLHGVSSSQEDPVEDDSSDIRNLRDKRLFFNRNNVIVSTSTSYSFVSTTIKKTVILGAAAVLSCLPAGYVVC